MSGVLTQVKGRDRSTIRQRGPCLTCHVPDIQYGTGGGRGLAGAHVSFGDSWLDLKVATPLANGAKPFVFIDVRTTSCEMGIGPRGRGVRRIVPDVSGFAVLYSVWEHEPFVRKGEVAVDIQSVGGINYQHLLKPYLCDGCKLELEAEASIVIEDARQRQRAAEQRRQNEELRRRYEDAWRRPKKGEFPIESASRRLALVSPSLSFRDIRLQWRTSKLYRRGSAPVFVMLLTVDEVFSGKSIFTNEPIQDYRNREAIDAAEYAATSLITRWLQREFQPELLFVEPLFVWDARSARGCSCNTSGVRKPGVSQTIWKDGSRYSALTDFRQISEIADFLGNLGYRIIEQHLGAPIRVSPMRP